MSAEVISAQKKRALEALERRFSGSKPEVPPNPYENKKMKKKKKERAQKEEEIEEKSEGRGTEKASTSAPEPGPSLKKGFSAGSIFLFP